MVAVAMMSSAMSLFLQLSHSGVVQAVSQLSATPLWVPPMETPYSVSISDREMKTLAYPRKLFKRHVNSHPFRHRRKRRRKNRKSDFVLGQMATSSFSKTNVDRQSTLSIFPWYHSNYIPPYDGAFTAVIPSVESSHVKNKLFPLNYLYEERTMKYVNMTYFLPVNELDKSSPVPYFPLAFENNKNQTIDGNQPFSEYEEINDWEEKGFYSDTDTVRPNKGNDNLMYENKVFKLNHGDLSKAEPGKVGKGRLRSFNNLKIYNQKMNGSENFPELPNSVVYFSHNHIKRAKGANQSDEVDLNRRPPDKDDEEISEDEEEYNRVREEQVTFPLKNQQNTILREKPKSREEMEKEEEEEREDWQRFLHLILLVLLAALGSIGNIFAIAALVTESTLRNAGNILVANSIFACLLVTAFVLPSGAVEILAVWKDPTPVCKSSWALTILAAHAALITLPCLAFENNARQHSRRSIPGCVLVAMVLATWCTAFSLTASQWAGGCGPTHCEERKSSSSSTASSSTACFGVPLVIIPVVLLITVTVHIHTLLRAPPAASSRHSERDCASPDNTGTSKKDETQRDLALVATNLAVGLITGALWASGIAMDWWGKADGRLNWLATIAASSCGFLYAGHRPFRDAYYRLFNYCFCKTSVSMVRRTRNDPPIELYGGYQTEVARTNTEHVRVHIIPPFNMNTQQCQRPPQHGNPMSSRPKPIRNKTLSKKDIYEL